MNGSGLLRRRGRRRVTFGLFGGPARRGPDMLTPASGAVGNAEDVPKFEPGVAERLPGDETDTPSAAAVSIDGVIGRLQREVLADRGLLALVPEAELARLVDAVVRELWAESRVKSFVPVLAKRRVRERLGLPDRERLAGSEVSGTMPPNLD